MKQITLFANNSEQNDFELIKQAFERKSDADTVRAMISFCKKNLPRIVDISNFGNNNSTEIIQEKGASV